MPEAPESPPTGWRQYFTLMQWFESAGLGENADYPEPEPEVLEMVVRGVLPALLSQNGESMLPGRLEEVRNIAELLADHEALSVPAACALTVLATGPAICLRNHGLAPVAKQNILRLATVPMTLNQQFHLFTKIGLAGAAGVELGRPENDVRVGLFEAVLETQLSMLKSCPDRCARELYEFALAWPARARDALIRDSTSHHMWAVLLRRLLTAVTSPFILRIPSALRDIESGQAHPHHDHVGRFEPAAWVVLPPLTPQEREFSRQLRVTLLAPAFGPDEMVRLRQECNIIEELHAHAGTTATVGFALASFSEQRDLESIKLSYDEISLQIVFRYDAFLRAALCARSFDDLTLPYELVVDPGGDHLDLTVQSLRELKQEDRLRARMRLRHEHLNRLSIPRYLFDELDAEFRR